MKTNNTYTIAVMAGDGIGQEVTPACVELIEVAAAKAGGIAFDFVDAPAGAGLYLETGDAYPQSSKDTAAGADAILLGAMGLPDVRYPDGTEIAPQLDLRFDLGLYAGVRPIRSVPGTPGPLADPRAHELDFVIIRESTEGLFKSRGQGTVTDDRVARDTLEITREVSEKLFDFSFRLAQKRKKKGHPGKVTCVDKANVFSSFAFFRKIFDERAAQFPDCEADYCYIDASALNLVRAPWMFDVMVTENMFGDILSDLGAGIIGGMGLAPSADVGDNHAVFQPCHGTAPDIAGQGKANPTAMFLSGAMMLDWLAEKFEDDTLAVAGDLINRAVDDAFARGDLHPCEFGGTAGTTEIFDAVMAALENPDDNRLSA